MRYEWNQTRPYEASLITLPEFLKDAYRRNRPYSNDSLTDSTYRANERYLAYLEEQGGKYVLATHPLDSWEIRYLEAATSIGPDFIFIPQSDYIIYRTQDFHLKVVDISIPQDSLIDYYDRVLPTLEELEAMED